MEAGDVSTVSLSPYSHSLVVSAHQVDMGINPAQYCLLI